MATHTALPAPVSPFLASGYDSPRERYTNCECAVCGTPFDEELDDDDYERVDGMIVCGGRYSRCKLAVAAAAFRRDSAHLMLTGIEELETSLGQITDLYGGPEIEDPGQPELLLGDIKRRMTRFAAGQPTGFHTGVMMDCYEAFGIECAMRNAIAALPEGNVRDNLAKQLLLLATYTRRSEAAGAL